jgi:hypothetical protein
VAFVSTPSRRLLESGLFVAQQALTESSAASGFGREAVLTMARSGGLAGLRKPGSRHGLFVVLQGSYLLAANPVLANRSSAIVLSAAVLV